MVENVTDSSEMDGSVQKEIIQSRVLSAAYVEK